MTFLKSIFRFARKEAVFCIALCCAFASAFFVPPSPAYIAYIDIHTLCILFALMGVVAGLRSCGVFDRLGSILCRRLHTVRGLCAVLVALCFIAGMVITNDVALLTFVPFALALLIPVASGKTVMYAVILQTVAANTGSMLTPLGNPQNLFLFQQTGLHIFHFMALMLPYTLLCAVLLALSLLRIGRTVIFTAPGKAISTLPAQAPAPQLESDKPEKTDIPRQKHGLVPLRISLRTRGIIYGALFVLCLLAVVRLIPKPAAALVVFIVLLAIDRKVLRSLDYMLLLTFCAFFVFTGNMANIPSVKEALESAVGGHEFPAAVLASQVISNVPATLLLYPFSCHAEELLMGVNAGGLGTLVASLASLISYKLYAGALPRHGGASRKDGLPSAGRYLLLFTVVNLVFLAALTGLYLLLHVISVYG